MGALMTGYRLSKHGFLSIMILFFSIVFWYAIFSSSVLWYVVGSSVEIYPVANAAFNFIIATTLMLSSFFIHKYSQTRIIYGSFAITSIVSVALYFIPNINLRLAIVFAVGAFFSIGQLSIFTYFWRLTVSEERGRVAGFIGFFVLPISHIVVGMSETIGFFMILISGVILSFGVMVIKFSKLEKNIVLSTKRDEQRYPPEKRTILLYAIPWILFSLVNSTLARNISFNISQSVPSSIYILLLILQMSTSGLGAAGGGIIADLFGRRLSLSISLTLYGVSTVLGGFVQNYGVLYFMYILNGLSWGSFWVLYSSIVWGDLSDKASCAKRYSLGLIIYYLATGVGSLLTNYIYQIPIITSSFVSCLLIFLSNIPLILAPELLSEDFRAKIKIKLYLNVIRKLRKQSEDQK